MNDLDKQREDLSFFIRRVRKMFRFFSLLHYRGAIRSIIPHVIKFVNSSYTLPDFIHLKTFIENRYGLEIGGPTSLFKLNGLLPLYPLVTGIDNCLYSSKTLWWTSEDDTEKNAIFKDIIISEASNLFTISNEKYDFVISSHMIEHLSNPIKALLEMKRVVKKGGAIIIIAPHKDITFDNQRSITPLDHMVSDLKKDIEEGSIDHLDLNEIYRTYDFILDSGIKNKDEFKERTLKNTEIRALHQHVFNTETILEIVDYAKIKIVFVNTNPIYGILVIGQRVEDYNTFVQSNKSFISNKANWRKHSVFDSDKAFKNKENN